MADLQWKIDANGMMFVRDMTSVSPAWITPNAAEAAIALQSAILATQEKCAQVADERAKRWDDVAARDDRRIGLAEAAESARGHANNSRGIASAIRALKMETGQ